MIHLPQASLLLWLGFVGISVVAVAAVIWGTERTYDTRTARIAAAVLGGWMTLTAGLAASGFLAHFDPPRLPLLLLVMFGGWVWVARSAWGARMATLPLTFLVGAQAFRIIVELCIHRAADEGIAPYDLTWEGYNFDIAVGVSALLLAPFVHRLPRAALHAWNIASTAILSVVVLTGLCTMPGPLQQWQTEPANVWLTVFPFVWLPTILVFIAIGGHIVLARRLIADGRPDAHPAG